MVVVSDTSPVRALAHLNCLNVLGDLFGEVLVPPAVQHELQNPPGNLIRVDVAKVGCVRVEAPQDQQRVQDFLRTLDPGESEALTLALEQEADAVLIDEAAGRKTAGELGLTVLGTLGILLRSKQKGYLAAVRPHLDRLENELGFFISSALRTEVLQRAGE